METVQRDAPAAAASLEALARIGAAVAHGESLAPVLTELAEAVADAVGATLVVIRTADGEGRLCARGVAAASRALVRRARGFPAAVGRSAGRGGRERRRTAHGARNGDAHRRGHRPRRPHPGVVARRRAARGVPRPHRVRRRRADADPGRRRPGGRCDPRVRRRRRRDRREHAPRRRCGRRARRGTRRRACGGRDRPARGRGLRGAGRGPVASPRRRGRGRDGVRSR